MKCPCCGAADLVHDTRSIALEFQDQMTTIPDVEGEVCPSCGEVLLDAASGNRYNALAHAFEETVRKRRVMAD